MMSIAPKSPWLLALATAILAACGSSPVIANTAASAEVARLGLHPKADGQSEDMALPAQLDDANWGLKAEICQKGGYDLTKAAGKTATFTSVELEESCQGEPVNVWVVTDGDTVVCAYFAVLPDSELTPGVWAVNDTNCGM